MNTTVRIFLSTLVCPLLALAQNASIKPLTAEEALKLGPEKIASEHLGDESLPGLGIAAKHYTTALRVKTESALAKKDVRDVEYLASMRETLSGCREAIIDLAAYIDGGGWRLENTTTRDCAEVEDVLAKLVAAGFPPPEGEGSAKARKAVEQQIAFLKKLKPGEAANDKELLTEFNKLRQDALRSWENIDLFIQNVSPEHAIAFVEFALGTMEEFKKEN